MTVDTARISAEDVVDAFYEAILGRPADRAGRDAHAAAIRAGGIASTLRAFVSSAEFVSSLGLQRRPSIALIGNCKASALAGCLRTSAQLLVRWVADVNLTALPTFRIAVEAMLAGDADFIVTQRVSSEHPAVETAMVRRIAPDATRTMTNVYLSGLHPDITYLGAFGRRLQSPLTDYHSRIVVLAYLRGDCPEDCAALFDHATYAKLGYFDEFERSAAELRRRDEGLDIGFADLAIDMALNEPTLLTVNHPTSAAIAAFAGVIARHCGIAADFAPDGFRNELLDHPIWPIYPEIGEALRLPYGTDFRFRAGQDRRALSVRDFVAGSYALYDLQGRDEIAAAAARMGLDPEAL